MFYHFLSVHIPFLLGLHQYLLCVCKYLDRPRETLGFVLLVSVYVHVCECTGMHRYVPRGCMEISKLPGPTCLHLQRIMGYCVVPRFFSFLKVCFEIVLLWSPYWPQTCRDSFALASWVLGLRLLARISFLEYGECSKLNVFLLRKLNMLLKKEHSGEGSNLSSF